MKQTHTSNLIDLPQVTAGMAVLLGQQVSESGGIASL